MTKRRVPTCRRSVAVFKGCDNLFATTALHQKGYGVSRATPLVANNDLHNIMPCSRATTICNNDLHACGIARLEGACSHHSESALTLHARYAKRCWALILFLEIQQLYQPISTFDIRLNYDCG